MSPAYFTSGSDWECSSGPIITRDFATADLWPINAHGNDDGGTKDILANGDHPVVAIGPQHATDGTKYNRPRNLTGVVISYNADADIVQVNVADKVCVKNWVANVLTYSGGSPYTFDTSMAIGDPVYVDDSSGLGLGTTLSRSPLNDDGNPNPLAGYLFYCQDEYVNTGVGGPNISAIWPKTVANSLVENAYCIILVNDYGEYYGQ